MRNQKIFFTRPAAAVFVCMFGVASLLMSCESQPIEEQSLEESANASTDAAMKKAMGELPHKELAELRAVVAPWHNFDKALSAGYEVEFTGYRSQMGFHYLKVSLLDNEFELRNPEVLIFAPAPNGQLRFVGVEYAVPIPDMENPQPAPEGFTGNADEWSINTEFEVWTLHVWVGLNNPNGIFAMHNPRLP